MSEAKLDLIAKLLAKAESTTPEEAEALTEHAERLMVKYGIEQARLHERRARSDGAPEDIVQEHMRFTGTYARDLRELGASIGIALGTIRPMYSDAGGVFTLHLIGFASDVRQAKLLTSSLQVQAMVAMRAWWATAREPYRPYSESDKRRARSGFLRGFGNGASSRIRENRNSIVEEEGNGTELVLASRRDRVDAFADALSSRTARARRGTDGHAFALGHRSGRNARTGEPGVASAARGAIGTRDAR